MQHQPSYVPLVFVACSGAEARARYGDIPWLGDELIVVGDGGEVWVGPAAFLTCLWALATGASGPTGWPVPRSRRSRSASSASSPATAAASPRLFEHDCDDGACRV